MPDAPSIPGNWPLAVALVLSALIISYSLDEPGDAGGRVEVRGYAEREVPANHAEWQIRYTLAAPDLETLARQLAQADEAIVAFLKLNGFADEEISRQPPRVTGYRARSQSGPNEPQRLTLTRTIVLRTHRVDAVRQAMAEAAGLIAQGVPLAGQPGGNARFTLDSLDDIRAEMLAEAVSDAQRSASRLAEQTGATLGPARSLNHGEWTISGAGAGAAHIKRVRVTATVGYDLQDRRTPD